MFQMQKRDRNTRRNNVRFLLGTATSAFYSLSSSQCMHVISLTGCEFIILVPRFPQITKEEVDIRRADDLPANIIFRMKRQWNIRVDQHSICVCLGVNGLDRPYEYEPVVDIIPSPVQVCIEVAMLNTYIVTYITAE